MDVKVAAITCSRYGLGYHHAIPLIPQVCRDSNVETGGKDEVQACTRDESRSKFDLNFENPTQSSSRADVCDGNLTMILRY